MTESDDKRRVLSDECVCGKPTENNKFWTNAGEQLCRDCTMFTIKGKLADHGFRIVLDNDQES